MTIAMPNSPKAWRPERTATGDPRVAPVWTPCPCCWQQGRIYARNLRDWWYCDRCLGMGYIPVVPR